MDELITMTAAELSAAMAAGDVSAADVTEAHLDQITAVDDRVKAFLHVAGEDAVAQARAVDAKRARGESLGALAGVPVAVKVLRPELTDDPEFRARFGREVASLIRVKGVCTVHVIEADTESPVPFMVTEYVPGPSL